MVFIKKCLIQSNINVAFIINEIKGSHIFHYALLVILVFLGLPLRVNSRFMPMSESPNLLMPG